jgi:PAS domain S-box-containing protein
VEFTPEFTRLTLDVLDALVVVLDKNGRIVLFNHACERLSGYSFDEMRGHSAWELIPADEVETVKRTFAVLLTTGQPLRVENSWLTKDGARRRISWSDAVLYQDGLVKYLIGTGIEVTDRAAP